MAENITLASLANLQNETTAVNAINNNNSVITTAFVDVLSRAGNQPNSMNAPLDMNNWPIMNLPAPGSANSPARLVDVTSTNPINISLSLTGDATAPASSGVLTTTVGKVNAVSFPSAPSTNTVPVVTSANTITYQQVNAAQIANNTITATQIANNTVTATQLAANTVGAGQFRQSAGLSIVGNAGTTTANVADITGTTRQILGVNTSGTALAFAQPRGDQLLGSATNDNATAGNIGEFLTATVAQASAIAMTTGTAITLVSLPLTAGDWDIYSAVGFIPAGTTTITSLQGSLSTTTNTQNLVPGSAITFVCASFTPGNVPIIYNITPNRVSISTTTTYFLVGTAAFATSTMGGFGYIGARRVR